MALTKLVQYVLFASGSQLPFPSCVYKQLVSFWLLEAHNFWDTEVGVGQNHSVASPTNDEQAQAAAFLIKLHATVSSRFFRIYYMRAWEPDGAYWSLFCSDGTTRRQSETVWADREISYTNTGQSCP